MITIRQFTIDDYEVVVDMLHRLYKETHGYKTINPKYFFYKEVMSWINDSKDIVVAVKDDEVIGFTLCFVKEYNGLCDSVYHGEYGYVYEKNRKSRAAYMLYHNAYKYSRELGMLMSITNSISSGASDMVEKHFGYKPKFTTMEG